MNKKISKKAPPKNSTRSSVTLDQPRLVSLIATDYNNVDRDYGLIKANQWTTPFPQKYKPIDLVALSAKLEAEKKQLRYSTCSADLDDSFTKLKDEPTIVNKEFIMRRKLFDLGEFTICKGHKLDDFHPDTERPLMVQNICSNRNSEELTAYCKAHNIDMATGSHHQ